MRPLRFNQGFPLDRNLMRGMLQCIVAGEATSDEAVGGYVGINPYKVQSMRGWFCKLGLGSGSSKQYHLSPFGNIVASYDPDLARPGTLWLLHYFLVSEHEERSEVWYRCFNEFLYPGKGFTREELREYVERSLPESPTNKSGIESDSKELTKTYCQDSALGSLEILTRQPDKSFVASLGAPPDPLIVAYVLFDLWRRRYDGTNTLRLSQLATEPETPGRVFVATPTQVRDFILHLQAKGLVSYADTQHEPVTRRFHDAPAALLEQYYQQS
ncbi:MAG: DUF4007 family protein [Chloroflexales bacterium]|nr:DUF4007 family protein [Chloroflexales bacterium]